MAGLGYVEDFVRAVHGSLTSGTPDVFPPVLYRAGQGSLFLEPDEVMLYRQAASRLVNEQAGDDLSPSTVEGYLADVLFASLDLKSETKDDAGFEARLTTAMKDLRRRLKAAPVVYLCHVPVLGLDTSGLPVAFGDVRLVRMTPARIRGIARHAGFGPKDGDESDRRFMRSIREAPLLDGVVAVTSVLARDTGAADRLAQRKTREVVDVLNFFAGLIPNSPGWVYLAGEAAAQDTTSVISRSGNLTVNNSRKGPLGPLSIQPLRSVPHLRLPFRRVQGLFKEAPRSRLTEHLITAVRWAGRASVELVPEHAFVQYAIALESLMLPSDPQSGVRYRLRTRVAHLLASTNRERQALYDDVDRLYKVRSDIVHDGSFEVSATDLGRLSGIARSCIIKVLTNRGARKCATPKDLARWLDTR